jgi:hypothetical protein
MQGSSTRGRKLAREAGGLLRNPLRTGTAIHRAVRDVARVYASPRHLYLYSGKGAATEQTLDLVLEWVRHARRPDGGSAAFYSLLTGWSGSYAETTGYLIPTVYDCAAAGRGAGMRELAEEMTRWLLSVQLPSGAFPGGTAGRETGPSVFNSGQILQGLVRAWKETADAAVGEAARRTGDWLLAEQDGDGAWKGATYQQRTHTYYTMVAWSLAALGRETEDARYLDAARLNAAWAISQRRDDGWFDGINLVGNPTYLHFVAYVLQGLVEVGALLEDDSVVQAAEAASWRLLRTFEVRKHLPGSLNPDWSEHGRRFSCLTGNAQMSCVWLRFHERSGDLRWLNAALKVNEMLKDRVPRSGPPGVRGGVAGSSPLWGAYQPFRYINWGAKFLADALTGEGEALARVGAA